jgi:tetratricopeptide (TPR) repeat protein
MILIWMIFLRADAAITVKNAAGGLKQFGIFMLPVIVLVGLVALRNYTVEPDMVLVSSNGGENFFMGNNPKSEGIYCRMEGISPDIEHQKEDVQKAAEAKAGRKLTRARASSYWMRQAMIYIRDNFPEYLRLEALKLKRIFSGTEYTNMYFLWFERAEFTKSLRIPAAHFYLVLPLAIIGAVLLARDWRKYALIYIMILLSVLNMLIFYVDERYRLPMVPFLILLGAGGIHRILEITRPGTCPESRKYGLLALIMAALAVTFYMSRTEPPRLEVTHQLYCNLGEVYYDKREYRKALDMFYKSSRMAVNNWESAVGVSKALFALGNRDTAVKLYLQAFPNLDREIQSSCLRDDDLDSLREYISAQEGNGNNKRK